jgi:hypothetical protein
MTKFRAQLFNLCPFWLLGVVKKLKIKYSDIFRKQKDVKSLDLIWEYFSLNTPSNCTDHCCLQSAEIDFGIKFSEIKIEQRLGRVIPQDILIIDEKTVFYGKRKDGSIYVHDIDHEEIICSLKMYSKFSHVGQFAFWIQDLSKFLNIPEENISKDNIALISQKAKRSIEIYELEDDLFINRKYSAYSARTEPLRLIIPCPDTKYRPVLVIYNTNILEVSAVRLKCECFFFHKIEKRQAKNRISENATLNGLYKLMTTDKKSTFALETVCNFSKKEF